MKKIVFLTLFALIAITAFAQKENKAVTAKLEKKYSYVYFSGGYYSVELNGKEGAADGRGKEIVAPKYDDVSAYQFEDGNYATVELNEKKGVVDKQGKEIVAPKYDDVSVYQFKNYGYAEVKLNGKVGLVNKQGKEIVAPKYDGISVRFEDYGYAEVKLNGKVGIVDKQGKEIVAPKYDKISAWQFEDYGYAEVTLNEKVGLVDKQGKEFVAPKYDDVSGHQFENYGYAEVELNGKVGIVDKQGNEIVAPKYDYVSVYQFKNYGYATMRLNKKWGIVDKQGNEIVALKYDEIQIWPIVDYGYAGVKLNNKWGAVDKQGNEIIPCEYTYIGFYGIKDAVNKQTFAVLIQDGTIVENGYYFPPEYYLPINGKWGLYDLDNKKWVAACKYEFIQGPFEGLAAFNVGGKITDVENESVSGSNIDVVSGAAFNVVGEITYIKNESISGGKWGYVDAISGKEIIPVRYETAGNFKDGAAQVSLNGRTTLIENPLAKGKANIAGLAPDVDANIPVSGATSEETFAFIFANENYLNFSVTAAGNDGKIFREYCKKTLGIPEKNIRFYENATIGNMASAVNRIKEIADTYDGDARFVVYYSGQGLTDEVSKTPYLLPVDAVPNNLAATGYSVEKLNRELSSIPAKSTLLILDAGFNGCDREGKMLTAARSVATKAKPNQASGSLIVLSAATSDETAYQYKDKNHGLLTYFLLKKLQETKGDITYQSLMDYVTSEVKKQSVSNSKIQSPSVTVSDKLTNWQTLKIR